MANETPITIVGNLTADPELRNVNGYSAVSLTIASTPRRFDRNANDWQDGETLFLRATAWRDLAENIAQRLHKGSQVIAYGNLRQRSFETKEGEKRTVVELDLIAIGEAVPRNKPNAQRAGQPQAQTYAPAPASAPAPAPQGGYAQPTGYEQQAPAYPPQPGYYSDEPF